MKLTDKQTDLVATTSTCMRHYGQPAYCETGRYKYWDIRTLVSAEKRGLVKLEWLCPGVYSVYPLPFVG